VVFAGGEVRGDMSVTEFRGMALSDLYCNVLRPLDLVPLTDFICKYHPGLTSSQFSLIAALSSTTSSRRTFLYLGEFEAV